MKKKSSQSGFSLIELIVVISILTLVSTISIESYRVYSNKNKLEQIRQIAADSTRQARQRACLSVGDGPWGLRVFNGYLLIFKGSSYASRDLSFDKKINWPAMVDAYDSSHSEVVFPSFCPSPIATSSLIFNFKGEDIKININERGIITY